MIKKTIILLVLLLEKKQVLEPELLGKKIRSWSKSQSLSHLKKKSPEPEPEPLKNLPAPQPW